MWVHSWDDKPQWVFKASGNAPKHERQVFPLLSLLSWGPKHLWTGLAALGNVKWQWLNNHPRYEIPTSGKHFLTHPYMRRMAFFFESSWCLSPNAALLEARAEAIMQRKESPLQCRRCPLTNVEGTMKSANKSILPSWLQLDPGSLWAFECMYGEDSSPGIVPAGSTKVKSMRATKAWPPSTLRLIPLIHSWHASTVKSVTLQIIFTYWWFWIFRVNIIFPLQRRKM